MLTHSVCIAAGVAVLLYVMDRLLKAWADKKDRQYFYGGADNTDDNETENNTSDGKAN